MCAHAPSLEEQFKIFLNDGLGNLAVARVYLYNLAHPRTGGGHPGEGGEKAEHSSGHRIKRGAWVWVQIQRVTF